MMVSVLRQFFGQTDRLSLEKASIKWDPDVSQSGVQIDIVDNVVFQEGQKFPKILVDMETQEYPRDFIGDLDNYVQETAMRVYTVRQQSAFSIECWGLKKLEAMAIGDEVRYFLQTYRKEISDKYCLATLRPKALIKPMKTKLYDDYWITRLIVEYEMNETWGVAAEALKVSSFTVSLNES